MTQSHEGPQCEALVSLHHKGGTPEGLLVFWVELDW